MERMKHTGDYVLDEINMLEQECSDLEEENKRLEEENKKLREENEKMRKHIRENGYIDDMAYIKKENAKLKEELDKREYYDKVNGLDKFVEMSNEMAELEKENKKLKEIMRDVLYRTTKHNIKNVVYKGEKIEIGNGDYDYTLD